MKKYTIVILIMSFLIITGCTTKTGPTYSGESARMVSEVYESIDNNTLGITKEDIFLTKNPKGSGYIAYVPKTDFYGIQRNLLRIILDDNIYLVNGATKNISSKLPWARESDDDTRSTTNLDKYSSTDIIKAIWNQ